jgi:ubiquinone biosynthesis protein UbiJ
LRDELSQRLVLVINHVLQQEPQAQQRIARLHGQQLHFQWQNISLQLVFTPAGLMDLASNERPADLRVELMSQRPSEVMHALAQGDKPAVSIHGDVRLAAEVNWLIDHVRWDAQADLARLFGDAAAYRIAQAARSAAQALKRFVSSMPMQTARDVR